MNILLYLILLPVSIIFGAVIFLRNKLFDCGLLKSRRFDIPVIAVGNIAVGGTGKTPHIEYLIEILGKNFKIAVLSRGYKRQSQGFQYVEVDDSSAKTGDEPLQIKRKYPDTVVAVNANRVKGIEKLQRDFPELDLVLLDDAFQHRQVAASLNLVLIDYNRPFWNDFVLPAGRLRDNKLSLHRADIVLITKCPENILSEEKERFLKKLKKYNKPVYFSQFEYGAEVPVFQPAVKFENPSKILGLSGIANPKPFFKMLKTRYSQAKIEELTFPDHHNFSEKDIRIILKKSEKQIIITTEKDSMRLFSYFCNAENKLTDRLFCIPVKVKIFDNQKFNTKIINHVRNRKNDG